MPTASFAEPLVTGLVPVTELLSHRADLLRVARHRLRDRALAEDVVHDVLEAVLDGRARYEGRSTLRTWLVGILKHKIVDAIRRTRLLDSLDEEDESTDTMICPMPRPDVAAETRQRLERSLAHIDRLPASLREAIRLRVLEDRSIESICSELGITATGLNVRVHRARAALRAG